MKIIDSCCNCSNQNVEGKLNWSNDFWCLECIEYTENCCPTEYDLMGGIYE